MGYEDWRLGWDGGTSWQVLERLIQLSRRVISGGSYTRAKLGAGSLYCLPLGSDVHLSTRLGLGISSGLGPSSGCALARRLRIGPLASCFHPPSLSAPSLPQSPHPALGRSPPRSPLVRGAGVGNSPPSTLGLRSSLSRLPPARPPPA